ncbi:MAG TPA: hypothetical protein VME42_02690 [Steroidobacteraceae bacterium]|nr:hypothetical protein [Steroidobacteraceae bacterium]
MSTAYVESRPGGVAAYGGLMDAIGGIAAAVIAVVGLTGFDPLLMTGIATIVFGAALLIEGGALLSEYAYLGSAAGVVASETAAAEGGILPMFLFGVGGIVLGVLAVLGIAPEPLTAIAVIAFGSALLIGSGSVQRLYVLQSITRMSGARPTSDLAAAGMAAGSSVVQLLSGLAAIVLGILAIVGNAPALTLTALLILGITELLQGSTLSGLVRGFMRGTAVDRSMR